MTAAADNDDDLFIYLFIVFSHLDNSHGSGYYPNVDRLKKRAD